MASSSAQVFKVEENKLADLTNRNQETVDASVTAKDENPARPNTSSREELDFETQAKKDQPAVGPDPGFSQKVLSSFEEKPLSATEIKENQKKWKKYTEQKTDEPSINRFPYYFFAGFWVRFAAFLIDLICIGSISRLTLGIAVNLGWLQVSDSYLSIYGSLSLIAYLAYFILLTKWNHGQTIGKMIFGIRVISFDEEELSWSTVLVREGACRFILRFPLLFVGYLPVIFSKKKQHIGDYFSNTSVVTINMIKAFNQEMNA
ncbi:RDD family protein [Enterococcus mundtii]|uniref:RDD family protein n=1 Tax=Enterococcus mundtii TaxID=53346 RepID=UPI000D3DB128|nr:RDD family protein [Enterococcus mundtii]PTO44535.1 RDD family protein [Enterococcus mundtii]